MLTCGLNGYTSHAQCRSHNRQAAPANEFPSWKEISPEGGGFSISFPAPPTQTKSEVSGGVIKHRLVIHHKLNRERRGGVGFQVDYWQLVGSAQEARSQISDETISGYIKALNAKLLSDKKVDVGGYACREVIYKGLEPYVRTLYLVTDTHVYLVTVTTLSEQDIHSAPVEHFFKSFKLMSGSPGSASNQGFNHTYGVPVIRGVKSFY